MDVIVIGCGAAGIAAMRKLHDAGLQVLGLEASDRIGGRIHTVDFGENSIDIGAAWCHGKNGNKVYELANPLGLLDAPKPDDNWYLLSNGDVVSHNNATEILNAFNDAIEKADKYSTGSISECVRSTTDKYEALRKDPKLSCSFIEWYERNSHLGGQEDAKRGKTLRGLVENRVTDGDILYNWKGRGFCTVLDVLMNKIPDKTKEVPLNILLNKEVDNIRWGSTQPGLDPSNPLVQVKCKDGSLYGAKSVIITMSVGVLQERHAQLFNPPLPLDKVNTIKNLQMCVLDKIYIEFEKPWWPNSPAKFALIWREDDKAQFSGEDQWITEIYGFWTVEYQPNVLLAWINGNGAKMMEKVAIKNVQAGIHKLMNLVLKREFKVTPIKNIMRSKWASNRLARGAYAHRTVSIEENGGGAQTLSEPLYHNNKFPVVCFAGEATSHHRHSGVDGAVESGFREAERLIESFKEYEYK